MASETLPDVGGSSSFFLRHEFAIRRLHSLSGIVPLGVYMVIHLTTNASLLNGVPTFQRAVYMIHSLGGMLPVVEWTLIFAPLLFHAIVGVWITKTGRFNNDRYKFTGNKRYKWQRITGLIAFAFLMIHVLHLHGWMQISPWLALGEKYGFAMFRPYNAASTLALAMDGYLWPTFYLAGVLACVYHLANGLWTAGLTWGLWVSAAAQKRASKVCLVLGILLGLVGIGAWYAAISTDPVAARVIEDEMYDANLHTGILSESDHKRTKPHIQKDLSIAPGEMSDTSPVPRSE
ncbi:MAG: succinate dehydrogenase cytochrome b558 subunit [Planctomycetaceae bacterium]